MWGPAYFLRGDYKIRHTMEGQEHIMAFQPVNRKTPEVKLKCRLVPLEKESSKRPDGLLAERCERTGAARVDFAGDKAKPVFYVYKAIFRPDELMSSSAVRSRGRRCVGVSLAVGMTPPHHMAPGVFPESG
jgi:hypothetical protein